MNLLDIMPDLEKPFPAEEIDFLPKTKAQFERDGATICIGLPFADPRAYQDRLNAVCPGEWSTHTTVVVAGSKLVSVVTVTIAGVPHTDVGEADLSSENAATESFAQAFKRACSQAGLGRYLYALDKAYLPWDKNRKRFEVNATEKFNAVLGLYKKAGLLKERKTQSPVSTSVQVQQKQQVAPSDTSELITEAQIAPLRRLYERLGREVGELPQTHAEAKALIAELSEEYKQSRTSAVPVSAQEATSAPQARPVEVKTRTHKELPDNAAVPKGLMIQITDLATAQKKRITRPTNYGEAKKLLAELNQAS